MKKMFALITLIAVGFGSYSCSNDDDGGSDTQKPVIVLNVPTIGETVVVGEELHLEADFSDNVALASYTIGIHVGNDGHNHKNTMEAWSYTQTQAIEGDLKNISIHEHLVVPTEVNGEAIEVGTYHLEILVKDKAGNEQQVFRSFEIQ